MGKMFLTGSFKLHRPSRRKRKVLDHVFRVYTVALGEVLAVGRERLAQITDQGRVVTKQGQVLEKYSEISVAPFLPRCGQLDYPIAANLKESVLKDAAASIASHLMLRDTEQDPGYPQSRDPAADGYPNALREFAGVGADLEDEKRCKRRLLMRAKGSVMPLTISRSRDFAILYDRENDRFFLWVKLLPSRNAFEVKTVTDQGNLIDLNTGEVFKRRSKVALLFPLEVGVRKGAWHWQYHQFLRPLRLGQASVQSAKLIRDESGDYFINISFSFDLPQRYEPQAYLGIDRGVFFSMAYGVVDQAGRILEMNHQADGFRHERIAAGRRIQKRQAAGKPVTVRDYRQKHLDSILHSLINDILDTAERYQAMIVFEDLNIRLNGRFYKSAWKKLYRIAEYKCQLRGIPIWKNGVFAAYTSKICIYCGELNHNRKRDGSPFVCPPCGAIYHSDEGAGVNIARRALYRKQDWQDKGGYLAFHRSFANEALFLAKNDLRKEGVGFG